MGLFKISPQGGGEGGLKRERHLNNCVPRKKGRLLERGGLIEDLLSLKYTVVRLWLLAQIG